MNDHEFIDWHIHWCKRRGLRPSYLGALRTTLTRTQHELGPLEDLTSADLERWYDRLGDRVGDGARVAYAAHMSSFYRWLVWERLRDDDPTMRLLRPRVRRGTPRPISDERLAMALGAAGQPVRSWFCLACFMGFRACEVAPLRREDIRTDYGVIHIPDGKGGKERTVPMHQEVARCLEYGPRSGYLYLSRGKDRPLTANSVSQRANRFLHELGISETFHQLRHWYGTNLYRLSTDLLLVADLMGHSDPASTAGYAKWSQEKAAAYVESLPRPA